MLVEFAPRALAGLAALCLALVATADEMRDAALAQEDRIAELERTVAVLASELERTRAELTVPEEPVLTSFQGLGAAASKVYQMSRGLSLGGYGEGLYTANVADKNGKKNRADLLRLVLYTGYRFNDNLVFNAEVEFEHATTEPTISNDEGGSVSVEFASLDYFWKDPLNARAGLLLLPMGFLNEIHEPPYYFGTHRPEPERRIIPTTWRENGAGIFGSLLEGDLQYRAYAMNGFNALGFDSSGLRGGRQKGSEALAEDVAFVGRVDWYPLPEWLVGGSAYWGKSGQDQDFVVTGAFPSYLVSIPSTPTTLFEVHSQYENRGLHLRGLFTMSFIGGAGALSRALQPTGVGGGIGELAAGEAVGGQMLGAYAEIAYEVMNHLFPGTEKTLEPFFRFEYVDTQRDMPSGFAPNRSKRNHIYTVGFSFEPIPQVVFKADYRNVTAAGGVSPADEVNLGIGFAF